MARALVILGFACVLAAAEAPDWHNAGIVDTRHSPYAKLHPVPVRAVHMREGFWTSRMRVNVERSIPHHAGFARTARRGG